MLNAYSIRSPAKYRLVRSLYPVGLATLLSLLLFVVVVVVVVISCCVSRANKSSYRDPTLKGSWR